MSIRGLSITFYSFLSAVPLVIVCGLLKHLKQVYYNQYTAIALSAEEKSWKERPCLSLFFSTCFASVYEHIIGGICTLNLEVCVSRGKCLVIIYYAQLINFFFILRWFLCRYCWSKVYFRPKAISTIFFYVHLYAYLLETVETLQTKMFNKNKLATTASKLNPIANLIANKWAELPFFSHFLSFASKCG